MQFLVNTTARSNKVALVVCLCADDCCCSTKNSIRNSILHFIRSFIYDGACQGNI